MLIVICIFFNKKYQTRHGWGARYFLLTNIKVDPLIFFAKKYVLSVYLGGGRSGFQAQHKKQPEDGKETGGGEARAAGHGS